MEKSLEEIVARIIAELKNEGITPAPASAASSNGHSRSSAPGDIDLPDPTAEDHRRQLRVANPDNPDGLKNLTATTNARLGVGRAGPRPRTKAMLLFQADHGVTQDAIYGVVSQELRDEMNLFSVTTQVADREEFLLRPDLGRRLTDEAKAEIREKCVMKPDVQIFVGDGLSAAAIENNLRNIYPAIEQGLKSAGVSVGTPFFIENCRVGVMNDVNSVIGAKAVVLLIGERPGLGIADAMSAYMGFDPQPGKTDADRDLICMITTHGGTNPLEAGAYIVEFVKRMLQYSASGVKLRSVAGSD